MRQKLYVLDVSGYIFRAYYALPPMTNPRGEATHALFGYIRSVIKLLKEFHPEHLVAVFDGPDNKKQRKELYEKYKSNRQKIAEDLPAQIDEARRFCEISGIPVVEISGVEADDAIGSIAVWASKQNMDVYLCTGDKDLCQLVNDHVFLINPWKEFLVIDRHKVEENYGVPPEQIIDLLAIMGDSSDNIPGLTGFGPKTAVALLKEFGSLEEILQNPEKVPGKKKQETILQEADLARLSYRLATIHKECDIPQDSAFYVFNPPNLENLRNFYLDHGFHTLVKELDHLAPPESTPSDNPQIEEVYTLIETEEQFLTLLETLGKASEICFDCEATHLRPMLAQPVGLGFSIRSGQAFYVPFNGPLDKNFILKYLKPFFEDPSHRFFGHNVKYDCHVLANVGIQVATISFDTILASYLLNSGSRKHSLDHLTLHYFGKVKINIKDLIGAGKKEISMADVPLPKISDYCCEDVDYSFRLKLLLEKELSERGLSPLLFDLELPLSLVLLKMERMGIYIDVSHLREMSKELAIDIRHLEDAIYALAGETFNLNSPKQLSHILFQKLGIKAIKKTATGLSTNADVLETLAKDYPIAQKILEFRTLEKLRSTYVDPLPDEVNPITYRIHPTYNQSVAATGRLSCQDPNLQNIPIRSLLGKKIREAFRPQKPGWSFLAADYSQIELRLLAHFSEDPPLIEAFNAGEDIHAYTASLVFGVPLQEVTSLMRHQAKAINFGIIYGQQAYGLSQELGIDMKQASAFIHAYFERYPKVKAFVEECIRQARKTGKSVTMIGRERDIPEIHSSNATLRNAAERLAMNTPLQGSAADLIKKAMLEIHAELQKRNMQSKMILQIHDELIFEAPDAELEVLKHLVKKIMESTFSLKVPLVVDCIVGKNWGEC